MTPRERILSILNGNQPDQVPWFGDLDYLSTSMICKKEQPENFKESDDYIQWHRDLGVGFYLQGFFPFKEIIENCEIRVWNEGDKRYREITTPKGILRECYQWLDISCSEGHVDYLLKSEKDLPAYNYVIENTRYEQDYVYAEKRKKQIGDAGALLVYTPRSPFMHLLAVDAGINNITMTVMVAPDAFQETIDLMKVKFNEAALITSNCPADIIMTPENLSSEMVGPQFFERYMRDIQTKWSNMIKNAGKFSCIHMDGTLKGLLRQECSVGLSFIEAVTPAPAGDVAIEDFPEYLKDNDTILWGGIPGIYFTDKVSDSDFDEFLKRVLKVMKSEPRYVLGVADQVPPDGLIRRIKRVRELVDRFGKYE
jgi:uroporphyrinogen-III decarboxylase